MIPLSEILSRVRTRHEQSSSTRWTDARIIELIEDGMENLAEATSFYERYVTLPVDPLRTWYDLRGFTPETVVRIKSVWSTNRTEWLQPYVEDHLESQWEDSTGDPQLFFTRGIHWLGVWPKLGSGSSGGYLRVYFSGIPAGFNFSQAVLRDLPDNYIPALEDYVLYEMSTIDREHKKALLHWKSYQEREKALHDFTDRRIVASSAGRFGGVQK